MARSWEERFANAGESKGHSNESLKINTRPIDEYAEGGVHI
jgi:hypothetical protein